MGLVDHVIVYTHLMRELLLANGIGAGKIEVSHYGIDTSGIRREDRPFSPPLRVGFVGTLAPHKGCDVLIRAFRDLPPELDATLDIYGNLERFKPFVEELRALAGEDGRIISPAPSRARRWATSSRGWTSLSCPPAGTRTVLV